MKVRAKNNMILEDGTFVKRNTVIDDKQLPEHMRTADRIDYEDLSETDGHVMLLHGLGFCKHDGYWMSITSGELIRLSDIPERVRECLKEGVDYVTEWNRKDHLRLRELETQRQQKLLQSDPLEFYDTTLSGWKIK
jgi:hypothetical protein